MSEAPLAETTTPQSNLNRKFGELTLTTSTFNDLSKITNPGTSLIIWERNLDQSLINWLSKMSADQLPSGRVLTDRQNIRDAIKTFFSNSKNDDKIKETLLANDIALLAEKYAEITNSNKIDIRLDVIQNDACWKFHLDRVNYRLVTTYIGEGTQYVSPKNADDALEKQTDYNGPIEKISEQDVAIFKGSINETGKDEAHKGIVHRSPPIKEKEGTRLLLCINARSDVSPSLYNS